MTSRNSSLKTKTEFQKFILYLRNVFTNIKIPMPSKRITAGVILLHGEKILLVLQRVTKKWGLPKGGKLENENIFSCALRELYEETGVRFIKE